MEKTLNESALYTNKTKMLRSEEILDNFSNIRLIIYSFYTFDSVGTKINISMSK